MTIAAIRPARIQGRKMTEPDTSAQYKRAAEFQASGNGYLRDDLPW